MKIGQRIIFDKKTGTILNGSLEERIDTGMTMELLSRIRSVDIDYIDLEWGALDNKILISVNPQTKELILEDIPNIETEEERLRREKEELENQLLLLQDEKTRGLL
ncbi:MULTISPECIES: hypothetical protein [unclassified Clostridium]|uniref:hypothetical protein n=1 Tax=unclassified Clostridium TaxID=2614128 RepID=UPI0025C08ED4|nr:MULTISPECIES: hypothetical protein [unclassified Clostridium]